MIKVDPLQELENRFADHLCSIKVKLLARGKAGRYDENKISEYVMRDILNVLYGCALEVETVSNSAGFDLCCVDDGLMVQVTSECTDKKVIDCLEKTARRIAKQPELTGFRLRVLFMTTDSRETQLAQRQVQRRLRDLDLSGLDFDPRTDVIDFNTLLSRLWDRDISNTQMTRLQEILDKYEGFAAAEPVEDRVQEVIDQYVDNFSAPLFMHTGDQRIILKNLYVEPAFTDPYDLYFGTPRMEETLEQFLWKQPRHGILLIEGDAAIGKTSLVSWMCHHYATADSLLREKLFRDAPVICVRLRELEFEEDDLSAKAVLRYLNIPGCAAFLRKYPNAIIILDGADELALVNNARANSISEFILNLRQELAPAKLIVTTRPKFLEISDLRSRLFHTQQITLNHFGRSKRAQWLRQFQQWGGEVSRQTEAYILGLTEDDAAGVADTPLALYLLASCEVGDELQDNAWALYHEIFSKAIVKAYYNNPRVWQSAGILDAETARLNYRVVEEIAFRMFRNSGSERYHITREELDEAAEAAGLSGITAEMVKQTCVLCAYWKNNAAGALEFYHNNIRAFFLCEYICDHLIEPLQRIAGSNVSDLEVTHLVQEICRIFCWGKISGTTWQQTFSFIALRLLSEARSGDSGTLFYWAKQWEHLSSLGELMIAQPFMWNYAYPAPLHPYTAVKQVFLNCLTLLHLLIYYKNSDESVKFKRIALTDISGTSILRNWHEYMLERSVVKPIGYISLLADTTLFSTTYRDLTLQEADFSRSSLSCVWFTKSRLGDSFWESAQLENVFFDRANLQGASFMDSDIQESTFEKAHITASTFSDSNIKTTDFSDAILKTVQMNHTVFSGCKFHFALLSEIQAQAVRFDECRFHQAGFSKVDLMGCTFIAPVFYRTKFEKVRMLNCHIEGPGTRIEDVKFDNVTTHNCTFRDLKPQDADVLLAIGFTEIT